MAFFELSCMIPRLGPQASNITSFSLGFWDLERVRPKPHEALNPKAQALHQIQRADSHVLPSACYRTPLP